VRPRFTATISPHPAVRAPTSPKCSGKDAGLTRGSFYSYFESKGDLYAEAVTQILNEKQLLSSDGVSVDPRALLTARLNSSATIFRANILRISTELAPDRLSDRLFARGAPCSASI
jgi:AcrR family transcriptional regulator